MDEDQTLNGSTRKSPLRSLRPTPLLCPRITVEMLKAINMCATLMPQELCWIQRCAYHRTLYAVTIVKPRLETYLSLDISKKCLSWTMTRLWMTWSKSRCIKRRSIEAVGAINGERTPTILLQTPTQREMTRLWIPWSKSRHMIPYSPRLNATTVAY